MLIAALTLLVVALGFAIFVDRYGDLREAGIEARFPPEGELIDVGGVDVHVVTRGTGPDLVLIHGAGGNARDFTFQLMDQLTDRYRVFAIDRPGHGWSDPIGKAASPAAQARHLAAALRRLGAKSPLILGHSYGGAVAMAWALEDEAAGLVILSGATMPWPGRLRRYYRFFGSEIGGAIGAPLIAAFASEARVKSAIEEVFAPNPVPPAYFQKAAVPLALRAESFRENARQVKTLKPHVTEMAERYPGLALPVEILHGTKDTTVRAEIHAVPLSERLPNAELTLIPGMGHAPHNVEPDTVAAAIDRAAKRAGLR
ncbi:MAG: alpha/beta hydrolase [Silicimonas sp.]|nr:alpha/beta hydrolase [Silicimonas sp.]